MRNLHQTAFHLIRHMDGVKIVRDLGEDHVHVDSIIEDTSLSISRGGIIPLGQYRDMWVFKKIESILKRWF